MDTNDQADTCRRAQLGTTTVADSLSPQRSAALPVRAWSRLAGRDQHSQAETPALRPTDLITPNQWALDTAANGSLAGGTPVSDPKLAAECRA